MNPFRTLRNRFRHWFESRLPLADSMTLTQRNVYILPTRAGFMLGLTLLVLLVASINYQLNLGYLLTFMLAGAAIVGMHVGHGTLRGITMQLIAPNDHFAMTLANFSVKINHDSQSTRHSIGLALLGSAQWTSADIAPQGSATLELGFTPVQRGRHRIPTLTAETRFPMGTFRVWTVWRPKAEITIYPAPEAHAPPLPAGEPRAGKGLANRAQNSGEFDGVRAYQRGDPLKLVVWKKAAKAFANGSDALVSRDTQQSQRYELWLDFAQCGGAGTEAKLSRLCAWVVQADKEALDYGLRLPGQEVPPGNGQAHKKRCLEALALC